MKTLRISQVISIFALILMVVAGATELFAAHEVPSEARFFQCTTVTLAPGQSVVVPIQYSSKDNYLKIMLEGAGADGVMMQVYTSEQNAKGTGPVGAGTPNKFEPSYAKTWEGRFLFSDTIYVKLTNTTNAPITFSLCSYERTWAPPEPSNVVPLPERKVECCDVSPDSRNGCAICNGD